MNNSPRLRRLKFRAWHRGTREADMMLGGFFDARSANWSEEEIAWYEVLLEEQDVDIMGWAMGTIPIPDRFRHPMMDDLCKLDFIRIDT